MQYLLHTCKYEQIVIFRNTESTDALTLELKLAISTRIGCLQLVELCNLLLNIRDRSLLKLCIEICGTWCARLYFISADRLTSVQVHLWRFASYLISNIKISNIKMVPREGGPWWINVHIESAFSAIIVLFTMTEVL